MVDQKLLPTPVVYRHASISHVVYLGRQCRAYDKWSKCPPTAKNLTLAFSSKPDQVVCLLVYILRVGVALRWRFEGGVMVLPASLALPGPHVYTESWCCTAMAFRRRAYRSFFLSSLALPGFVLQVDVKKLAAVLSMYALRFDTAICCIIGG